MLRIRCLAVCQISAGRIDETDVRSRSFRGKEREKAKQYLSSSQ